jgi:hemerythrin-like domain-containing protein
MEPVELLRGEHRAINRVLDLLDAAIAQARAGQPPNLALFWRAADFLLNDVERAHHGKEKVLLKEMVARGLPIDQGVIAQLSGEHAVGRELAEELRRSCELAQRGGEVEPVLLCAEQYVRLHRAHTLFEEQHVLPLAQRLLDANAMDKVRSKVARLEARFGPVALGAQAVEVAFGRNGQRAPSAAGGRRP